MVGADNAVVSEPFANKHHVHAGDVLPLTLAGQQVSDFRVTGIYYDYSNERGYVIVDRPTLLKYLPDTALSNLAVYLKPGVSLEARQESGASGHGRPSASKCGIIACLREDAIQIFDRTFAITYALEAVAVIVAIMGVAGALLALVIDRRRELGLLRFLGGAKGAGCARDPLRSRPPWTARQYRRRHPWRPALAAPYFRDQQAIFRLDYPISLAGCGIAGRADRCIRRHCTGVFLPGPRRDATQPDRGDP